MKKLDLNKNYPCPNCGKAEGLKYGGSHAQSGKPRWVCRDWTDHGSSGGYCYSTTNPLNPRVQTQSGKAKTATRNPQYKRKLGGAKRFVITAAQNATPVHDGFFAALQGYCKHTGAELIVIPIRYKNPTSTWTASQSNEEVWAPELQPYLYNQRKKLCPNLVLLGDIKTRPTASGPLTGFEGITHGESGILGHTKLQLKTIPTPQNKMPKILTTTGAVTRKNYTDSKAGKLGEFHHMFGAATVEIKGSTFHLRQIQAMDDGSFIDDVTEYLPNGKHRKAPSALGLILGDIHYRVSDPSVIKATFGSEGMVKRYNPEYVVFHDLLDGMACNPHHRGNPFAALAKRLTDYHLVHKEVEETIDWLIEVLDGRKGVVVSSNHNNFLSRWVADTDWRQDPDNAWFYLETAMAMLNGTEMLPTGISTPDPFNYWVNLRKQKNIRTLSRNDSFMIGRIECSLHGDQGPNGARGSIKNLSRLGVLVSSGHGHSPGIEEGHHRGGTSSYLGLDYAQGPSSWLQTHGLIYGNGKRTLINMINGKYRT